VISRGSFPAQRTDIVLGGCKAVAVAKRAKKNATAGRRPAIIFKIPDAYLLTACFRWRTSPLGS
jgi:hypothetical protein